MMTLYFFHYTKTDPKDWKEYKITQPNSGNLKQHEEGFYVTMYGPSDYNSKGKKFGVTGAKYVLVFAIPCETSMAKMGLKWAKNLPHMAATKTEGTDFLEKHLVYKGLIENVPVDINRKAKNRTDQIFKTNRWPKNLLNLPVTKILGSKKKH